MSYSAKKRIGTGDVRAMFGFVHRNPGHLVSESQQHDLLRYVFSVERGRIQERIITSFVAFMESAGEVKTSRLFEVNQIHPIPGRIDLISLRDVQSVLAEKKLHASPSFRKAGNVSTHPPQFLTKTMLVVVAGSRRFLMDNADLYLEQEGILRESTFELLKDIADLSGDLALRKDNYLSLDISHKAWYRGNVEALGQIVAKAHEDTTILSTSELMKKLDE